MCIPLHLIIQQARPYGARMFKPPEEEPEYPGYGWMGGASTETKSDLKENEYRFWRGSSFIYDGSEFAQCRSCMIVCRTEELRKKHQKAMECTKHLVRAYKLLLAKRICVICNAHTASQKWGIPICATGDCRKDFRTHTYLYGLQQALNGNVAL